MQMSSTTTTMAGSSGTTSALLEKRLRVIERQLGLEAAASRQEGTAASKTKTTKKHHEDDNEEDLIARLTRVEAQWHEKILTAPKLQAAHDAWIESLRSLDDLDPGTALTHQQHVAAPLLYRRQEVLASAQDLAVDFRNLSTIVSLLLIGQGRGGGEGAGGGRIAPANKGKPGGTAGGGGGGTTRGGDNITASQVSNAPILVEPRVSDEEAARLANLAEALRATQERVDRVTNTLDRMLRQYQSALSEISEKTVRLDAELTRRGV